MRKPESLKRVLRREPETEQIDTHAELALDMDWAEIIRPAARFAAERIMQMLGNEPTAGAESPSSDELVSKLVKLCHLKARCKFSRRAMAVWESYQCQNRSLLQSENDEAQLARLNGAPRHVQKIAMLFQVSSWAKQDQPTWNGIIDSAPLQLAIAPCSSKRSLRSGTNSVQTIPTHSHACTG